ncbi:membrane-spanning 4-domains subfamily A member 13-like [Chionomys nivalis]|uniref:membrane-spanning 4-domains subfamily A member 13-like n=1 Tax=Chionomys nivalis TaxID=269649 RepID=UPI002592FCE9|nr:membrane-spanning 4-domains subfamily A member 13-like [Chionomys nivalis]
MEVAAPLRQVLPAEIPKQEDLDLKETPEGLPSSTVVIIRRDILISLFVNMLQNPLWIKQELRLLGTVQLMTSLIVLSLGYFWTYLYISQNIAFGFGSGYIPVVKNSGYSLWASLLFSLSGSFSIALQKRPSNHMLFWTMTMNISSIYATLIGVVLITFELTVTSALQSSWWEYRSGKMLTAYLFLFTVLEMFMACTVTEWTYKASQTEY